MRDVIREEVYLQFVFGVVLCIFVFVEIYERHDA